MQALELLLKGHEAGPQVSWLWIACSLPLGFCLLALARVFFLSSFLF